MVDLRRSSEPKKLSEEVPTKEALESFIRNSKVLHKLVNQDSQTVDADNIQESMDESMLDVPVANKSKRDSKDTRKSSSSSQRPSNRDSKSFRSARDSSISKDLPKRTPKDESSFEESFKVPDGSIFESTRKSLGARTPPDSPRRKYKVVRSPPDSPRRNSLELEKTVELSSRKFMDVRTPVASPKTPPTSNPREATPLANDKHPRYTTGNSEVQETETAIDDSTIKKNKLYRTSLQKWRPGGQKISCPNCGETRQPVIRAHTERVAHSAFGASLIATCWPFCLAPCLFPEPFLEFIHCSVCDHYLGKYDHQQKLLSPNTNSK